MNRRTGHGGRLARRLYGGQAGFTLIELLLAITLLLAAVTIAYTTFQAATRAWQRGTQVIDAMGEGDLIMERLTAALRSAVYFPGEDPRYAFLHERRDTDPPSDSVSWVTVATGFLPPDAPLAQALCRIEFSLEPRGEDRVPALVQRAWWHLIEDPGENQVDTRVVSRSVREFRVRMFDDEDDMWVEEWDRTPDIPRRVEITLRMPGGDSDADDVVIQRHIEIPIAPLTIPDQPAPPGRRAR